jgi:hypothetical protein
MKCSKPLFAVAILSATLMLMSLSAGALHARDANTGSLTVAAAQTAKQKCVKTCRARYRDCLSLKQIPSFECQNVYQDCVNFTCRAVQ